MFCNILVAGYNGNSQRRQLPDNYHNKKCWLVGCDGEMRSPEWVRENSFINKQEKKQTNKSEREMRSPSRERKEQKVKK